MIPIVILDRNVRLCRMGTKIMFEYTQGLSHVGL